MNQLSKTMQFRDLVIMGLLFIGPAAAVGLFGVLDAISDGAVGMVYLVATVVMGFTAYSYAQMSRAVPKAGAVYAYASAGIHPYAGMLVGWALLLDYLFIPAVAYLFTGISLNAIFPQVPVWLWTFLAVGVTTSLNLLGGKKSGKVTLVILLAELAVLFLVLGAGIYMLLTSPAPRDWLSPFVGINTSGINWSGVFAGVSIAVLSYLGFDAIATFSEEHTGGKKQIGKAMLVCLILAGVLFVLQTYIGALLSPHSVTELKTNPALQGKAYYDMVNIQLGEWLGWSLALMKAIGAAFAAMVGQAAAGRLLFSMARDNRLPKVLAHVDERRGVPTVAILSTSAMNLLVALMAANVANGLKHLVSFVDIGALVAFIMLHVSVMGYFLVKQKQRRAVDWFKFGLIPALGIIALLPVVLHIQDSAKIIGLIWLFIGVCVFSLSQKPLNHHYRNSI